MPKFFDSTGFTGLSKDTLPIELGGLVFQHCAVVKPNVVVNCASAIVSNPQPDRLVSVAIFPQFNQLNNFITEQSFTNFVSDLFYLFLRKEIFCHSINFKLKKEKAR